MDSKQVIKFLSLGVSGLLVVGFLVLFFSVQSHKSGDTALSPVSTNNFGGSYTLVNHLGETVTEKDLKGQYQLLYFGFTYCPAICPAELSKIADALDMLGEEGKKIQPVFISVDPERDTPQVMRDYIGLFHPRLIGYTGTIQQIEDIKKKYKVYSTKVDDPSMSDYTVDHSSYIYFMGPEGQLLSLYKVDDGADYIAENIGLWLEKDERP